MIIVKEKIKILILIKKKNYLNWKKLKIVLKLRKKRKKKRNISKKNQYMKVKN